MTNDLHGQVKTQLRALDAEVWLDEKALPIFAEMELTAPLLSQCSGSISRRMETPHLRKP
jgi:hypothetical protein